MLSRREHTRMTGLEPKESVAFHTALLFVAEEQQYCLCTGLAQQARCTQLYCQSAGKQESTGLSSRQQLTGLRFRYKELT